MSQAPARHERWMRRALELARQGEGLTRPNPPVGAVCVRGGRMVGEGFHARAGSAHAEVAALEAAGRQARNATLYVTLEPCSTTGRTPPCCEAIARAGVKEVVAAVTDPNPVHAGKGFRDLRRQGIRVTTGVCKEAAAELIEPFARWVLDNRPFFTLKLAISLDGRIADFRQRSKWLTGALARRRVQGMRRRADAILVGRETVACDDPQLLPRPTRGRRPYRVVVDTEGRIPARSALLTDAAADRTIIATSSACSERMLTRYKRAGVRTLILPRTARGVSLPRLARKLAEHQILHVLCEGGGQLAASLIRARLVDEFQIFMAPCLLGEGRSAVAGISWPMDRRPILKFVSVEEVGKDILVTARPAG